MGRQGLLDSPCVMSSLSVQEACPRTSRLLDFADFEHVDVFRVVPSDMEPVSVVLETAALVGDLKDIDSLLRCLRRVVGNHGFPETGDEVLVHRTRLLEGKDGRRQHHPQEHENCAWQEG